VEAELPDQAGRRDHREDQRVVQEGGHLGAPDDAGGQHEEADEAEQQRQRLDRHVELERLVERARVEDDAERRGSAEGGDREVDRRQAQAGRAAAAVGEHEDPRDEHDGQDQPVELEVDRQ
jgi:hypothetical protein